MHQCHICIKGRLNNFWQIKIKAYHIAPMSCGHKGQAQIRQNESSHITNLCDSKLPVSKRIVDQSI